MTVTRLGLNGEAKCSLCDKTLPDTQDYFENGVDCCRQCDGGEYLNRGGRAGPAVGSPAPASQEGMKECKVCKTEKPRDEFYKEPKSKDGRMGRCKACINEGVKKKRLGLIKTRAKAVKKEDKPKRAYNRKAKPAAKPGKSMVKARNGSGQLTEDWQGKMLEITGRIKQARNDLAAAKEDLKEACTQLIEEI